MLHRRARPSDGLLNYNNVLRGFRFAACIFLSHSIFNRDVTFNCEQSGIVLQDAYAYEEKPRAEESGNCCGSDSLRCLSFQHCLVSKVQQSIRGRELWCSVASVSFLPDIDSFCVSFLLIFKRKRGLNNYWRQTHDCDYCFWTIKAAGEKSLSSLPRRVVTDPVKAVTHRLWNLRRMHFIYSSARCRRRGCNTTCSMWGNVL